MTLSPETLAAIEAIEDGYERWQQRRAVRHPDGTLADASPVIRDWLRGKITPTKHLTARR